MIAGWFASIAALTATATVAVWWLLGLISVEVGVVLVFVLTLTLERALLAYYHHLVRRAKRDRE